MHTHGVDSYGLLMNVVNAYPDAKFLEVAVCIVY